MIGWCINRDNAVYATADDSVILRIACNCLDP